MVGYLKTVLLAINFSRVKSMLGNNNKLESMATSRVPEIRAPRATVPPKSEVRKTENPKNKTTEV